MYIWEVICLIIYIWIIICIILENFKTNSIMITRDLPNDVIPFIIAYMLFFTIYFVVILYQRVEFIQNVLSWIINTKI